MKTTPYILMLLWVMLSSLPACSDDLQSCLDGCGEPAGIGQDAHCGEDGWVYPSQCRMDCYGIKAAQHSLYCASPVIEVECDDEHVGLGRTTYTPCGGNSYIICSDPPDGWTVDGSDACLSGAYSECIQACPLCPEDDADFVCGKKGVRYCNECVMTCLKDQLAEDQSSCSVEATFAGLCQDAVDTYATRINGESDNFDDYGCNLCSCAGNIWGCTFWACPGNCKDRP